MKLDEFSSADEKVKIWIFIGYFRLKEKLSEQKIDSVVSCPDSEKLWKILAKSKPWFTIQDPKKYWNVVKFVSNFD